MNVSQDVEGVDYDSAEGWGDYPLDAVFVRTESRSVNEVVTRILNQRYVLDPDFQRDFVWSIAKQSKLIESCVMRIPLPVFYVAEAPDGRIIVVDGLQRLTTFVRFLQNSFRLSGLSRSASANNLLEGRIFVDLPISLQERVLDTQLTMYILDAKAPERARLDIFERVNSGEPLTRQQMRNALYNGPATQWLKYAAESNNFRSATGQSLNSKTMRDREAINRFCAFKIIGWQNYLTGDMDSFLAEGLKRLSQFPPELMSNLFTLFEQAMIINRELFRDHAFRKSLTGDLHGTRSVINISLFEVCSVVLTNYPYAALQQKSSLLKPAIIELLKSEDFIRSITYSTNSTVSVHKRFQLMESSIYKIMTL